MSYLRLVLWLLAAAALPFIASAAGNATNVHRSDFKVASAAGIEIFVREIRASTDAPLRVPILLVHGGGPAGLTSFDLPVPGYSFAEDLAVRGHKIYVMDVRGWGASTRPAALDAPPAASPPAVTVSEAAEDIGAVIDWIRVRDRVAKVDLFGWASGGHWSAYAATGHNEKVGHLILLNSLYGVDAPWAFRGAFEDPVQPGRFNPSIGAYGLSNAEALLARWNRSIPTDDKSVWRDPRVTDAYVREALASDPISVSREPPSMRVPTAFRQEAYEMSRGRKYWDAADIRVPTLVVRGELDFWSRPEDLTALERELVNAPAKRLVTIPGATHYLLNDRPERGRTQLLQEISKFVE